MKDTVQLLDCRDVAALLRLSLRYFSEQVSKKPEFPKPIIINKKSRRWTHEDIQNFLTNMRQQ